MDESRFVKWVGKMADRCVIVKYIFVGIALVLLFIGLGLEWLCTGRLPNKLG